MAAIEILSDSQQMAVSVLGTIKIKVQYSRSRTFENVHSVEIKFSRDGTFLVGEEVYTKAEDKAGINLVVFRVRYKGGSI